MVAGPAGLPLAEPGGALWVCPGPNVMNLEKSIFRASFTGGGNRVRGWLACCREGFGWVSDGPDESNWSLGGWRGRWGGFSGT